MSLKDILGKKYKMEFSENFGEYLKEIGVSWGVRKIATSVKPIVELLQDGEDYVLHSYTSVRNSITKIGTNPDSEYEYEAPDGRIVKSKFVIKDTTIHEFQKDANGREVFIERIFSPTEFYMVIKIGNVISNNIYKLV